MPTGAWERYVPQAPADPLDKVAHLGNLAPINGPGEFPPERFEDCDTFLAFMRGYVTTLPDRDWFSDRQVLWERELGGPREDEDQSLPTWAYLRLENRNDHEDLQGWAPVFAEGFRCSAESLQRLRHLAQTRVEVNHYTRSIGSWEALRILAHMLKDKRRNLGSDDEDPEEAEYRDWSGYLMSACQEAMEAIRAGEHVKDLRRRTRTTYEDFDRYPQPFLSSGSVDLEKGKGKGKDMGKGMAAFMGNDMGKGKGKDKGMGKGMGKGKGKGGTWKGQGKGRTSSSWWSSGNVYYQTSYRP